MVKILYITKEHHLYSYDKRSLCVDGVPLRKFPLSGVKYTCYPIRILNRIFRLEPRCMARVCSDLFIIVFQKRLYVYSVKEGDFKEIIPCRKGFSNPLHLCSMYSYGDDKILWGDYGQNSNHEEINIYQYTKTKGLTIVHTFPAGTIRHIHNIVYDEYHKRFFIFTGDFEKMAGIYVANTDFSEVKPFLIGKQDYRCVIGRLFPQGLLYATDATMQDNYLYFVDNHDKKPKKVCDLHGSVIYGTKLNNGLIISTTVEPYPSVLGHRLLSMFDYRLGKGIKSKHVDVLYITNDLQVKRIVRLVKDIWPMRLCQYGQVEFPEIEEADRQANILCSPMAVRKYDGKLCEIKLDSLSFDIIK